MYRFSRPPAHQIGDLDSVSLSRWVAQPDCDADDLKAALVAGFNVSTWWEQVDIEESDRVLTKSSQLTGSVAWANVNTPLHRFSLAKKLDAVRILLDNGAQTEALNAIGRTALHEAVDFNLPEIVRFLIENKADANHVGKPRLIRALSGYFNLRGSNGWVPLHDAVYNSSLEIVEMLVRAGADYNQIFPGGWSILDLAFLHRDRPIIDLLVRSGAQLWRQSTTDETESVGLQQYARLLLSHRAGFPSEGCRNAYLHVIHKPEFVAACRKPSTSLKALDIFLDLLSRVAELPNPEKVPGAPCCNSCAALLEQSSLANQGPFELHPDLHSLTRNSKDGCCLCAVFEDALKLDPNENATVCARGSDEDKTSVSVTIAVSKWHRHLTVLCGRHERQLDLYPMSECFVFDYEKFPDDVALGTASPRAFETARAWIRNCKHNHPCCKGRSEEDPALPTRTIDVGDSSKPPFLHRSNGARAQYLALSYCWGHKGSFRTTKASLGDHEQEIPLKVLPATLRDAVTVTRALGFRYLWIDALCIVQDDAEDWSREAAKMQSVYTNAAVTLSALASDDSRGGLFRSRGSRFVSPVPLSLRFPPRYRPSWGQKPPKLYWFVLPAQASKRHFTPGPVNSRAWTLQEQHLSHRIIHFGSDMMYWECLSSYGTELDPEGQTCAHRSLTDKMSILRKQMCFIQGCPSPRDLEIYGLAIDDTEAKATAITERLSGYLCKQWQDLVSEYSSRSLTEPKDKVPAFLGLSRILEYQLQDQFLGGLWTKSHLLPSLLWNTVKASATTRNPGFPSWTWASVTGKVQYRCNSFENIVWEPSEVVANIQTSGPSQNRVTGSITLKSTVRKFPPSFEFGLYSAPDGHGPSWALHRMLNPGGSQNGAMTGGR